MALMAEPISGHRTPVHDPFPLSEQGTETYGHQPGHGATPASSVTPWSPPDPHSSAWYRDSALINSRQRRGGGERTTSTQWGHGVLYAAPSRAGYRPSPLSLGLPQGGAALEGLCLPRRAWKIAPVWQSLVQQGTACTKHGTRHGCPYASRLAAQLGSPVTRVCRVSALQPSSPHPRGAKRASPPVPKLLQPRCPYAQSWPHALRCPPHTTLTHPCPALGFLVGHPSHNRSRNPIPLLSLRQARWDFALVQLKPQVASQRAGSPFPPSGGDTVAEVGHGHP